jgi:hypothetical protein
MKSEGLLFFTDTYWTLIGLLNFFISFFILTILHMRTYRHETLKKIEQLPLDGDVYE